MSWLTDLSDTITGTTQKAVQGAENKAGAKEWNTIQMQITTAFREAFGREPSQSEINAWSQDVWNSIQSGVGMWDAIANVEQHLAQQPEAKTYQAKESARVAQIAADAKFKNEAPMRGQVYGKMADALTQGLGTQETRADQFANERGLLDSGGAIQNRNNIYSAYAQNLGRVGEDIEQAGMKSASDAGSNFMDYLNKITFRPIEPMQQQQSQQPQQQQGNGFLDFLGKGLDIASKIAPFLGG